MSIETDPSGADAGVPTGEPAREAIGRRAMFSLAASSLASALAACGPAATSVLDTPEGRVLQWERDDLLVLVSGLAAQYRVGDAIRLTIILNNQTQRLAVYRPRTKLTGRGGQVLAETAVESVTVKPLDAASLVRALQIPPTLERGEYAVAVELPAWTLDSRPSGSSGGTLSAPVRIER